MSLEIKVPDSEAALQIIAPYVEQKAVKMVRWGNFTVYETLEVPCGWWLYIMPRAFALLRQIGQADRIPKIIGGYSDIFIINRWTAKVHVLNDTPFNTWQPPVREYIDDLPEEQRNACQSPPWSEVWTPEPIRFFPTRIRELVVSRAEVLRELTFDMECDNEYLSLFPNGIPEFKGTPRFWTGDDRPYVTHCRILNTQKEATFTRFQIQPVFDFDRIGQRSFGELLVFVAAENSTEAQRETLALFPMTMRIEIVRQLPQAILVR